MLELAFILETVFENEWGLPLLEVDPLIFIYILLTRTNMALHQYALDATEILQRVAPVRRSGRNKKYYSKFRKK